MIWSAGTKLNKGQYTIDEVLSQKRLSITYLATSEKGDRVVIKAINDAAIPADEFQQLRQRFNAEAFKLLRCQHPHIVKVEDPFEEGNLACIPMEFIAGMTLDKRNPLALPEVEAVTYVRQIGEALGVLHGRKLLHRDITPENIIRRSRGGVNEAVLIDFGLVRDWEVSRSITMMSSDITAFTAPELCDPGEPRGDYTDLYGLGAVLYALIVGKNPPKATGRKSGEALPFPVGTNPQIVAAIESAMQLDPTQRPQTVAAWLKLLPGAAVTGSAITGVALSEVVPASKPEAQPVTTTEHRKKRVENWQIATGVVGAIAALIAAVGTVMQAMKPSDPPKEAPPKETPKSSAPASQPITVPTSQPTSQPSQPK